MLNRHKNGNLPLFCIGKDTRGGGLIAFACVFNITKKTGCKKRLTDRYFGASAGVRTRNRSRRRRKFYPIELRVHIGSTLSFYHIFLPL